LVTKLKRRGAGKAAFCRPPQFCSLLKYLPFSQMKIAFGDVAQVIV
jgi:hypothetical protein